MPMSVSSGAALLIASMAMLAACTSMEAQRVRTPDPNQRLDQMLALYEEARRSGSGCDEIWRVDNATIDCERILREVDRLYAEFPNNMRIMMATAAMNYDANRLEKAQFVLDQLLTLPRPHPEAAILRSKLALEEGNTRLARELIDRHIMLAPDHPELREAHAAVHYFRGEFDKARAALAVAEKLGSPNWRLLYHHGLIAEGQGKWQLACDYYSAALEQQPNYAPAAARMVGLGSRNRCVTFPEQNKFEQ